MSAKRKKKKAVLPCIITTELPRRSAYHSFLLPRGFKAHFHPSVTKNRYLSHRFQYICLKAARQGSAPAARTISAKCLISVSYTHLQSFIALHGSTISHRPSVVFAAGAPLRHFLRKGGCKQRRMRQVPCPAQRGGGLLQAALGAAAVRPAGQLLTQGLHGLGQQNPLRLLHHAALKGLGRVALAHLHGALQQNLPAVGDFVDQMYGGCLLYTSRCV